MVTPRGRTYQRETVGNVYGGQVPAFSAIFSAVLASMSWDGGVSIIQPSSVQFAGVMPRMVWGGNAELSAAPAQDAPATLLNDTVATSVRFSAGMAFRQGDIPAGIELVCADVATFQGVVLNRWPDDSVKYAVVAGTDTITAGATAGITVTGEAGSPGTPVAESVLATAAPDAVITFSGIGSVALVDLIGVTSTLSGGRYTAGRVKTVFEGPLCSSWVYYSRIASHEHLSAWFEVRCWSDGAYEILPWIENGWWNVTGPTSHVGTVSFNFGGVEQMSAAITLCNHQRVPLLPTNPEPYRFGASWATLLHDPSYLQSTNLVPSYYGGILEATLAAQVQDYIPLNKISMDEFMGAGGYSKSIGLIPEWDATYAATGDKRARRCVLANGFGYGRWGVHYRDETTNRPVAPSGYPGRVLNSSGGLAGIASMGSSGPPDTTPTITGTAPPSWAMTHHTSGGYVAYLVSGWNYLIEETQFISSTCHYKMGNADRQQAKGIFRTDKGGIVPRGAAWATRTSAQAASLSPDADTMRAEYVSVLQENINFNHATYVAQPNNVLGMMAPYTDAYTGPEGEETQVDSTTTAVILDSSASPTNDAYNGGILTIGSETRTVTDYIGSTRTVIPDSPFTVAVIEVPYRLTWGASSTRGLVTDAASTTTNVVLANADSGDDYYNHWQLTIGSETREVTDYVKVTRTATVSPAFTVDVTDTPYYVNDYKLVVPVWMEDFITAAYGYTKAMNPPISGIHSTQLDEFFMWKAKSVVGRFGTPGNVDEFHYCDAAQYQLAIAPDLIPNVDPDFIGGTGPFYETWGEVYEATLFKANESLPGDVLRGEGYWPSSTSYWANQHPALSYAVQHKAPGADLAYTRMSSDPQWQTFVDGFKTFPVWGVKPAPLQYPAWRAGLTPFTWNEIPTARTLDSLNPANDPALNPNYPDKPEYMPSSGAWIAIINAWNGTTFDWDLDRLHFGIAGGHASYAGNDDVYLDLRLDIPDWIRPRPSTGADGTVTDDRCRTQAGSTTTEVVLASAGNGAPAIYGGFDSASDVDGTYVGGTLLIGPETRTVTAYNGTTHTATVNAAYGSDPTGKFYLLDYGFGENHGNQGERTGRYADGRARSMHNYNRICYAPVSSGATGIWVPVRGNVSWSASVGQTWPVKVDKETGEHSIYDTVMPSSAVSGAISGAGSCWDEQRNSIWYFAANGSRFGRFNPATLTWVEGGSVGAQAGGTALCRLEAADRVIRAGSSGTAWSVYNPNTDTLTPLSPSGTMVGSITTLGQSGVEPVPGLNRIAWWNNSTDTALINYMDIPDDPEAGPWVIQQFANDPSNTVTPAARQTNGTYGKFRYSPALNGFVLVDSMTRVLFYALD